MEESVESMRWKEVPMGKFVGMWEDKIKGNLEKMMGLLGRVVENANGHLPK